MEKQGTKKKARQKIRSLVSGDPRPYSRNIVGAKKARPPSLWVDVRVHCWR